MHRHQPRHLPRHQPSRMTVAALAILPLAILPLAACTTASSLPAAPTTTPHILNTAELAAVEQGVRSSLKDPGSMIMGAARASDAGGGVMYVCGTVNAKNSYGGYVGDQPFVGVLGSMQAQGKTIATFNVVAIAGSDTRPETVMTLCGHYGVV